jgi:hypothetical protein
VIYRVPDRLLIARQVLVNIVVQIMHASRLLRPLLPAPFQIIARKGIAANGGEQQAGIFGDL